MSALSKVGMSVSSLLVVRFGGCGSDGVVLMRQGAESDWCPGAAWCGSAGHPGGGRSDVPYLRQPIDCWSDSVVPAGSDKAGGGMPRRRVRREDKGVPG